jgi:hypothetical protein
MHQVVFRNVPNDWHNALPVGNGKMGAMIFFRDHELHIALNHYDCYYHVLPKKTKDDRKDQKKSTFDDPARMLRTYEELRQAVLEERKTEDYDRAHYLKILHPEQTGKRPAYKGSSYPMAGEIVLYLDENVDTSTSCLRLAIEEGKVYFCTGKNEKTAEAKIFVPKTEDGVIIDMKQSVNGLWKEASMTIPSKRGQGAYHVATEVTEHIICFRTSFQQDKTAANTIKEEEVTPFIQETVFYLPESGNHGEGRESLSFPEEARQFTAFASVMPGNGMAVKQGRYLECRRKELEHIHDNAWNQFWTSSVRLPDYFLETLWHLHVYLMECSSGRGSAYPEQACGLSGLWDIRRPNMWGSMWYWDANIQTAFYGTYSSGHPELIKIFCDGYLAYEEEIREYTKKVYGTEGWALDYPHTLYHCIQPWCAQFLWLYYQYSGDNEFLEKKAYPVMREQIRFFKWLAKRDENGIFHLELDICPEQGTIGSDTVIAIACIKKLLTMAIEAAGILNRPECEAAEMREILLNLPEYSLTSAGKRWKDSPEVNDNLFMRHPSVLMPVFPAGEVTWESDKTVRDIAEETLKYAVDHTEIGTFGPGWLSMAAANLKKGTSAQRILYEKLLDYELHSNGLGYEESERFINYCHITKPAHELPPMMEVSGCIVNTVNLMLLQAEDAIHIFPAIPDGDDGFMEKIVQYREDEEEVAGEYPGWKEAEFTGLMAPGGFVVSAQRREGRTIYVCVESTRENFLKLQVPGELSDNGKPFLLQRHMKQGERVVLGKKYGPPVLALPEVSIHKAARTHRRIFIGENEDTGFYKAVDSFTCTYGFANENRSMSTPYIFDFGRTDVIKNYDPVYQRQSYLNGQALVFAAGPQSVGIQAYSDDLGYGFPNPQVIAIKDRARPDDLRRDFLEGSEQTEFLLELPKGKYDFLVISGDEEEDSLTTVSLPEQGTRLVGAIIKAGRYQCRILPYIQQRDGLASIRLETGKGMKWKLNAIFVNKEYAFL